MARPDFMPFLPSCLPSSVASFLLFVFFSFPHSSFLTLGSFMYPSLFTRLFVFSGSFVVLFLASFFSSFNFPSIFTRLYFNRSFTVLLLVSFISSFICLFFPSWLVSSFLHFYHPSFLPYSVLSILPSFLFFFFLFVLSVSILISFSSFIW